MPEPTPSPFYIDGSAGLLFAVLYEPYEKNVSGPATLILQPFAEEMNRSRRVMALMARRLAKSGVSALILDLFGTGDSEGNFADASWQTWIKDATAGLDWLKLHGHGDLSVLGVRLGACMALEAAVRREVVLSRVILWQPVLHGKTHLNQFLRIRVASGMRGDNAGAKETVAGLRERLRKGETLEVAGYSISSRLAADIEAIELVNLAAECVAPLYWVEISGDNGPDLTPASESAIRRLRNSGVTIEATRSAVEPFWLVEWPVTLDDLLDNSADVLFEGAPV